METINIKFDEEQLEEVVKKVTEELKEEKDNFYELSDTGYSDLSEDGREQVEKLKSQDWKEEVVYK